jgi:hypothetical protein
MIKNKVAYGLPNKSTSISSAKQIVLSIKNIHANPDQTDSSNIYFSLLNQSTITDMKSSKRPLKAMIMGFIA